MNKNENRNPFVEIIAVTLGIFMVITIMFLIFARSILDSLVPISLSFMVMGVVALVYQYKLSLAERGIKKK